ncbi:hypothetical protein G8764_04560 [Pseudomaricurvus alcaniphilus]|uniref:hypothetical protein n=1 Tax=Pseudomaricurvus alcaniphilus TaxID=1166482 RepID=UPI00140B62FA|nr:hypothetical protein [Pseudomaricurvus alcaniphilus]NHN36561.1 hypothetical protein [Pseudomaricurvus alcaniphilus]
MEAWKEALLRKAALYLREVLGDSALSAVDNARASDWATTWENARQLPFYLQDAYHFYRAELLGQPCLLMLAASREEATPAVVQKHWQLVVKQFDGPVIYVVETVASYNRKRLIEHKVAFLVPGNQLYLPMLGMDLREHFKPDKKPPPSAAALSSVAQLLVLRSLLGLDSDGLAGKKLAKLLGYSAMTLTRALKELADRDLAEIQICGREKHLQFNLQQRELWQAAKPHLQNPVKKRIWVRFGAGQSLVLAETAVGKISGEGALAQLTMIAEPAYPIWALNAADWAGVKTLLDLDELDRQQERSAQVQLWRYNPGLLSASNCVDPLSLWLSLQDSTDERIELARDELLQKVFEQGREQTW